MEQQTCQSTQKSIPKEKQNKTKKTVFGSLTTLPCPEMKGRGAKGCYRTRDHIDK